MSGPDLLAQIRTAIAGSDVSMQRFAITAGFARGLPSNLARTKRVRPATQRRIMAALYRHQQGAAA